MPRKGPAKIVKAIEAILAANEAIGDVEEVLNGKARWPCRDREMPGGVAEQAAKAVGEGDLGLTRRGAWLACVSASVRRREGDYGIPEGLSGAYPVYSPLVSFVIVLSVVMVGEIAEAIGEWRWRREEIRGGDDESEGHHRI